MTPRPALRLAALLADLACVLVFALGGRSTHDSGDSGWVVLAIAWPFALALVAAHGVLLLRGRDGSRPWPEGAVVVGLTYVVGMALRVASGRGVSAGFPVVAALFLLATMLGWRGVVSLVRRSRRG